MDVTSGNIVVIYVGVYNAATYAGSTWLADGVNGIYAWGAQVEEGAFPSSYMPTTTVAATRAADAVTCSGNLNTVLTSLPQSAVVDCIFSAIPTATNRSIIGGSGSEILLYAQSSNTIVSMFNGSAELPATLGNSLTFTGGVRVAGAQATGQRSVVGGGGTVATDASTAIAMGSPGYIGSEAGNYFMSGYFRRIIVWNSKLADATLQALTAP